MQESRFQDLINERAVSRFAALQAIVCCPQSKTPLTLIPLAELLSRLPEGERQRVRPGTIGAFVSEASSLAYPIIGRVGDFLEEDALRLSRTETLPGLALNLGDALIKQAVRKWYDGFGWKQNESGQYNDTALFSQAKPSGHGLYELLSHLSCVDRLPGGGFILDAASGAIAHPEYLAFSWFYQCRVCVDVSLMALQEAHAKLGDKAFCCLADICHLPFKDETFDGAVSGYTIQHVPEGEQARAVKELYRTLKEGSYLCIITELRYSRLHSMMITALRAIRKVVKLLRLVRPMRVRPIQSFAQGSTPSPPHQLYCAPRDLTWWRGITQELTRACSLEAIRLFNKSEFELLFGESTRAAKFVRALETCFPKTLAALAAYCLIALRKERV